MHRIFVLIGLTVTLIALFTIKCALPFEPSKDILPHAFVCDGNENVFSIDDTGKLAKQDTVSPWDTLLFIGITDTVDKRIAGKQWNFGDGDTDTMETVFHAYRESGIYNATYTIFSTVGDTLCDSVTVYVNTPPDSIMLLSPARDSQCAAPPELSWAGSDDDEFDSTLLYCLLLIDEEGHIDTAMPWSDSSRITPERDFDKGVLIRWLVVVRDHFGAILESDTGRFTIHPDDDVALSSLSLSNCNLSPEFSPDDSVFTGTVDHDTTTTSLSFTARDPNALIRINGAKVDNTDTTVTLDLPDPVNFIALTVTAADNKHRRIYVLEVSRRPSDNSLLSNLTLSSGGLQPEFSPERFSYHDTIPAKTSTLSVIPTAMDAMATITLDGTTIPSGDTSEAVTLNQGEENKIVIEVTAQDGETRSVYTIDLILLNAIPAAPSDVTAASLDTATIQLTWQDNTSDETGYEIERRTADTTQSPIFFIVNTDATSFSDSGLSSGTEYRYRIRALTKDAHSSYSSPVSAVTSVFLDLSVEQSTNGSVRRAPDRSLFDKGDTVIITAVADSGYDFLEWTGDADGNRNPLNVIMDASKCIGARFVEHRTEEVPLTVVYVGNNNTGGTVPIDSNSYTNGSRVKVLPNYGELSLTGNSFSGWNSAPNGNGIDYFPDSVFIITGGNVLLYAKWTPNRYWVSYSGNENTTGLVPDTTFHDYGATVSISANKGNLVKTGHKFIGWNTRADGTGADHAENSMFAIGDSNMTLYAKWSTNIYRLTYDGNGASGNPPAAVEMEYGDSLTIAFPDSLEMKGYSFTGWNTARDGSATTYITRTRIGIGEGDLTLYALWERDSFTVSFNKNNMTATGTMKPLRIASGSTMNLTANSFTAPNMTFAGWATVSTGPVVYADTAPYTMATGNDTLYAQWDDIHFTVTFDPQGGSTVAEQLVISGSYAMEPPPPIFEGKSFAGWYREAACIERWIFTSNTIDSAVTLYAKWNAYRVETIPLADHYIEALEAVDIDNNGTDELVLLTNDEQVPLANEEGTLQTAGQLSLWRWNGTMQKTWTSEEIHSYPYGMTVFDIDNNGYKDLLVSLGGIRIYFNNNATFTDNGYLTEDFSSGDIAIIPRYAEGSGYNLIYGGPGSNSPAPRIYAEMTSTPWLFLPVDSLPTGGGNHTVLTLNVNGDNIPDLIDGELYSGKVWVFTNNMGGEGERIITQTYSLEIGTRLMSMVTGDFNNDGLDDFCINRLGADMHFYMNIGDNVFNEGYVSSPIGTVFNNETIDFDFDEDLDLLLVSFEEGALYFFENDGSGNFTEHKSEVSAAMFSSEDSYGYGITVGDFDGDHSYDIAFGKDPVIIIYNALSSFKLNDR